MDAMEIRCLSGEGIPEPLRLMPHPCRTLFVAGELPPDAALRVAMVGSRAASPGGEQLAYEIAFGLALGRTVVSLASWDIRLCGRATERFLVAKDPGEAYRLAREAIDPRRSP